MTNEEYRLSQQEEQLRRKSLSGSDGVRSRERRIRMKYKDYVRSLKVLAVTTAVAVSLAIGAGTAAVHHIQDNITVNHLVSEFQRDCINHETHRTQDNEHYFYDYDDIADYCEEMGDFDLGIYLFDANTNDYQTGRVLAYTSYESLDGYLDAHGWEDADEWKKNMREKIVLNHEIEEKKEELRQMAEEHQMSSAQPTNQEESTMGGGK